MPHMVVFRTNEGKPGYHLADTLDDAVRFVEHLRNNEQVQESKVYRMHEVPIEFKVHYKVEVAGTPGSAPAEETVHEARVTEAPPSSNSEGSTSVARGRNMAEPVRSVPSQPQPAAVSAPVAQGGGRFGLFSRA